MLTDADRIRNLLGTYCHRIDAADFDGVGELFASGGLAAGDDPPFARGAAEVASFYRSTVLLHDGSPRTSHVVANSVFADPDRAGIVTVKSSYVVFQAIETPALVPIITGRYVDRFGRHPSGSWHFVERRFNVDLVGDLSQHLGPLGPHRTEGTP